MNRLIDWVVENPTTHLPIFIALVGVFAAVLGGFLTSIVWPWLKRSLEKLWDRVEAKFYKKKFEHQYLTWVIKEHQFLPILPSTLVPVTQVNVQELDKLYVSLAVAAGNSQREVSLGEGLREASSLVIVGDPGAGKTTMLRFLALTFAQARRRRSSAKVVEDRIRDTGKIRKAQFWIREELGYKDYPLPIFVYLNRLRDVIGWPAGRSLLDALRDEWRAVDMLRDSPVNFLDEKLRKGECIFLLDAFDELGTQAARDAIAKHIGHLASTAPQGNRFIVTSRIIGYNGQLARHGFSVLKVQRLSWELICELVTNWYSSLREETLGGQLLATLKSNQRIADLAVNPMLLSLIVLVQYVKRIIPDRRHFLYDECVKILVERRYAPPEVQQAYNNELPGEEATFILQEIAKTLHLRRLREISRTELEAVVIPNILIAMPATVASLNSPVRVLRNIEERSQLLVERGFNDTGEPVMAFSHLTFQEYLTSVSLRDSIAQRSEATVSHELIESYRSDRDWWEEVALLYAAQLNTQQRADFFFRLYPEGNA